MLGYGYILARNSNNLLSLFLNFKPVNMSRRNVPARTNRSNPKRNVKKVFTIEQRPEKVEVLPEPVKSESDKKLYKTIRLANGLRALLISDPSKAEVAQSSSEDESGSATESSGAESAGSAGSAGSAASAGSDARRKQNDLDEEKLAAVAVCVSVGSYSDPPQFQGLAHFVEHMLFMGSTKYPKENDFDQFIKKKGGSDNAATDCQVTSFYLEIQERHLLQAMDKFSQFFVSPLMRKEAMQREREAIESEFAIAKPSDSNRKDQLLASTFPPGHPARTFTWGNLRSLQLEVADDEQLYRAAHDFRRRHYSAHRMTLAVQARLNLTTLEEYVVNTFGQIAHNQLPPPDFEPYAFGPHLLTDDFTALYYVKPLSDTTEVNLTWMMPPLLDLYESKPHQYISHLLGHEGVGSLLSYLKKKVWAVGIYAGNNESGIDYTTMYSLFNAKIVLTKEGLKHIDEVTAALFSYLNMLRRVGPSKRIFDEIKSIEETNFKFETETQPAEYVEELAEKMQQFPPEHYITGDQLFFKYDPQAITQLLECLRPETVNIMVLSNRHEPPVHYDAHEKWFGTEYTKKPIPKKWLEAWSSVPPYDCFKLPEPNVYITTDFELIEVPAPYGELAAHLGVDLHTSSLKDIHKKMKEKQGDQEVSVVLKEGEMEAAVRNFRLDQPNLLRKSAHLELWYKPDFKFRFPTALLYFYFITPFSLRSPKEACLIDLWTDVLNQNLKEVVYPANMAELNHAIYAGDKGLMLSVNGYSQNLHLVVELISREMRVTTETLSPELFEAVRDVRARYYHNALLKPNKLSRDVRLDVLVRPYISTRAKAEAIHALTREDLQDFGRLFLSQLYVQMLVQGNMAWPRALSVAEKLQAQLQWEPLDEHDIPVIGVRELPMGDHAVRVSSFNRASTNSIVTNYYQSGPATPNSTAAVEILMMAMEEPVFDQLRTKEQLGYSVFSLLRYTYGVLGFSVQVAAQADKHSTSYVDRRIEAFLLSWGRSVRRMSEATLHATRRALLHIKYQADVELKDEVDRNWREITNREYVFDRIFREADAISKISLSEVKRWFEDHTYGSKVAFRKLSVQIVGHKGAKSNVSLDDNDISGGSGGSGAPLKRYELQHVPDDKGNGDTRSQAVVDDVAAFKSRLPLYPHTHTQLSIDRF